MYHVLDYYCPLPQTVKVGGDIHGAPTPGWVGTWTLPLFFIPYSFLIFVHQFFYSVQLFSQLEQSKRISPADLLRSNLQ